MNMYSTYNEGKSVVAERFIRTLKNKKLNCINIWRLLVKTYIMMF